MGLFRLIGVGGCNCRGPSQQCWCRYSDDGLEHLLLLRRVFLSKGSCFAGWKQLGPLIRAWEMPILGDSPTKKRAIGENLKFEIQKHSFHTINAIQAQCLSL